MIAIRILLAPGRRGRIVDASGRAIPQPLPAPVIGSAEPLRIILLDPATLDPADPYGFDTGAPLRLTVSGDWDPATVPVYATNALVRSAVGTYDLADPSGTRTAEALALLGVLAERLCAWELSAYGGDPATEADWAHPLSVVQFDAPLRQRCDSLGGDPAEAPAVDLRGPAGTNATIEIGETSTLAPGSSATVENVGTPSEAILNFGIPKGADGDALAINVDASQGSTVVVKPNAVTWYSTTATGHSYTPRISFDTSGIPSGKSAVAFVNIDNRGGSSSATLSKETAGNYVFPGGVSTISIPAGRVCRLVVTMSNDVGAPPIVESVSV